VAWLVATVRIRRGGGHTMHGYGEETIRCGGLSSLGGSGERGSDEEGNDDVGPHDAWCNIPKIHIQKSLALKIIFKIYFKNYKII
jgi:hypothetical protein